LNLHSAGKSATWSKILGGLSGPNRELWMGMTVTGLGAWLGRYKTV
jgi:hypothetical protein